MTKKLTPSDIDNLVERYSRGDDISLIAEDFGITKTTVHSWLNKRGVVKSRKTDITNKYSADELFARHVAGETIQSISDSIGFSRISITRLFEKNGLRQRSYSEAAILSNRSLSDDFRKFRASFANAGRRGATDSPETKVKRASGMRSNRIGIYEREIIERLTSLGVTCEGQYPVGHYNTDIFIHSSSVAVEVYSYHPSRVRMAELHKRTEYLLDMGLSLLTVQVTYPSRIFDIANVCDRIIAFSDFCRCNHPSGGQYGVIRGNGEIPASSSHYLDHLPPVFGF